MPFYCLITRLRAIYQPQFIISLNSIVFYDDFIPNVDAVYEIYKSEIKNELSTKFKNVQNSVDIERY